MVRKRKKHEEEKPWCFYCDREFNDENDLILHQKNKHFKCPECNKRLSTAKALSVHSLQVHKLTIHRIPDAKEGRDDPSWDIFGSAGIPEGMKRGEDPPRRGGAAGREPPNGGAPLPGYHPMEGGGLGGYPPPHPMPYGVGPPRPGYPLGMYPCPPPFPHAMPHARPGFPFPPRPPFPPGTLPLRPPTGPFPPPYRPFPPGPPRPPAAAMPPRPSVPPGNTEQPPAAQVGTVQQQQPSQQDAESAAIHFGPQLVWDRDDISPEEVRATLHLYTNTN